MGKRNQFFIINPNEYGGLLIDWKEFLAVKKVLFNKKIFRYADNKRSEVDKFELKIKKFLKKSYALGLNNGSSALKTALYSVGVKPNDKVLISAYTFIATPSSVLSLKAIPVPVDFDFVYGLNINDLKNKIKEGVRAIIVVHLQGRSFNLHPVLEIATKNHIPVIEDACQSFGATYKGKFAGCFGDIGVYSFQQNKQITAGEGGLLVTDNRKYFNIARNYSDYGSLRRENYRPSWDDEESLIGDNYRMNNLQAAILLVQLKKFSKIKNKQKTNMNYILNKIKIKNLINSPDVNGETKMNLFLLTDSKDKAEKVIYHARNNNIEFRRLWPKPFYLYKVFKREKLLPNLIKGSCPIAEDISERLLSLSLPPTLNKKDLDEIIQEIFLLKKLKYIS